MSKRSHIRAQLYEKFGGICYLCEKNIDVDEITVDHIVPKSKGGANHMSNYAPAHSFCNSVKGSMLEGYEEVVKQALKKAFETYGIENPTRRNWNGRKGRVKTYIKREVYLTAAMIEHEKWKIDLFKRAAATYAEMIDNPSLDK